MTAECIRSALRTKYSDHRRYAVAEEVGLTTGFSHRRLDMMVLDCYFSNGFRIDGFEIKVSTSDLRRELEDPEKHIAFFEVIDYYTLVVPKGVADPLIEVIPKKWGILVVNEDGSTRYKRKPLALDDKKADEPVPRGFLASIVRAIQGREPATQALESEYQRGLKEGKENEERRQAYMTDRVAKDFAKIQAYDELDTRLRIYGDDVSKILDEFEAFRKLDTDLVAHRISHTIEKLEELSAMLKGEGTKT